MKHIWIALTSFFKTKWGRITAIGGGVLTVVGFILAVLQFWEVSPVRHPTPTSTPAAFIEKVELTEQVYAGGEAVVAIRTLPGSTCHISFLTPAGSQSTASALDFTLADSRGSCRWSWRISGNMQPGAGTVSVRVGDLEQKFTIFILSDTSTPASRAPGPEMSQSPVPTPALPAIFDEFECVPRATPRQAGLVESVLDGNTIEVRIAGGGLLRVRYLGVATPWEGHPWFAESKSINERLVLGQPVILVKDQAEIDVQGNLLRYVFTPETFVNFWLVAQGYGYTSSDGCACTDMFINMESGAAESDRGFSDWPALGPDFNGHPLYDYPTPTPRP